MEQCFRNVKVGRNICTIILGRSSSTMACVGLQYSRKESNKRHFCILGKELFVCDWCGLPFSHSDIMNRHGVFTYLVEPLQMRVVTHGLLVVEV